MSAAIATHEVARVHTRCVLNGTGFLKADRDFAIGLDGSLGAWCTGIDRDGHPSNRTLTIDLFSQMQDDALVGCTEGTSVVTWRVFPGDEGGYGAVTWRLDQGRGSFVIEMVDAPNGAGSWTGTVTADAVPCDGSPFSVYGTMASVSSL